MMLQLREVASPSSPDGPVRFEIPLRGVIRDVDPSRCQMSTAGYARVSTDQQSLDQQRDALTAAGCERLFTDQLFGVRDDRPGLAALLTTPVLATWWWSWLSTASAVRCPRSSAPSRPSPRPVCCCARCARAPTTPPQPDGARRHLRRPGGLRARAHERTRRRGPARPPAPAAGHRTPIQAHSGPSPPSPDAPRRRGIDLRARRWLQRGPQRRGRSGPCLTGRDRPLGAPASPLTCGFRRPRWHAADSLP